MDLESCGRVARQRLGGLGLTRRQNREAGERPGDCDQRQDHHQHRCRPGSSYHRLPPQHPPEHHHERAADQRDPRDDRRDGKHAVDTGPDHRAGAQEVLLLGSRRATVDQQHPGGRRQERRNAGERCQPRADQTDRLTGARRVRGCRASIRAGEGSSRTGPCRSARIRGGRFCGGRLPGARLPGARLPGARLPGARLRSSRLPGARLPGARLRSSRFAGGRLRSSRLRNGRRAGSGCPRAARGGVQLGASRRRRGDWDWVCPPHRTEHAGADHHEQTDRQQQRRRGERGPRPTGDRQHRSQHRHQEHRRRAGEQCGRHRAGEPGGPDHHTRRQERQQERPER
ncbi:pentapeptide repeat-containing protein [Nakamurella sp. A5-74]|uniref:Pentapeptide repeat-containing protein n=1 Tax=Nakamurella sp. A5-74 TaxID=3158264 RepID=A0AAU8DV17_9ACTN